MARPLLFADEFNAPSFWDATYAPAGTWRTDFGYGGLYDYKFNDEKQIYTGPYFEGHAGDFNDGNYVYGNGTLSLVAHKTTNAEVLAWNQGGYSSGMITTRGLEPWLGGPTNQFSFQYGYIEARIDPSEEQGAWNALWLLPAGAKDGGWAYEETDIMEKVGQEQWTWHAQHGSKEAGKYAVGVDTSVGFHTYALDWTPTKMTWFIDGIQTFQIDTPAGMHQPMVIIANLAAGGSWPGTPNFGSDGAASMVIDYIKVWGMDGASAPATVTPAPTAPVVPLDQTASRDQATTAPAVQAPAAPTTTVSLAGDYVKPEGTGATTYFIYDVFRDGDLAKATTVDYAITGITQDDVYSALSGKVWFGGGESHKQIWVEVKGDSIVEADETFTITLSNLTGAGVIVDAVATGVILNDDVVVPAVVAAPAVTAPTAPSAPAVVAPAPTGSVATGVRLEGDYVKAEGTGATTYFIYDVYRDGDLRNGTTVDYAITGITQDDVYSPLSGKVWFGGGESYKQIWVEVKGDTVVEADEAFTITLSNLTGAGVIVDGVATGVILNDDFAAPAVLGKLLKGTSANNVLTGTDGADTINGAGGDDRITGGAGDDLLTGGSGNDRFYLRTGFGHDTITDFAAGGKNDSLVISKYLGAFTLNQIGSDLEVAFSGGDSVLLLGVSKAAFTSADWSIG